MFRKVSTAALLCMAQEGKKALEDGKACIDKIDEASSKGLAASTVVEPLKGK